MDNLDNSNLENKDNPENNDLENNNLEHTEPAAEPAEKPAYDTKRKILNFCYGFFGLLLIPVIIYLFERVTSQQYAGILSVFSVIPMAVLGLVLWGIFRLKNKPMALGFLVGGLSPFLVIFLLSGGCGLVNLARF